MRDFLLGDGDEHTSRHVYRDRAISPWYWRRWSTLSRTCPHLSLLRGHALNSASYEAMLSTLFLTFTSNLGEIEVEVMNTTGLNYNIMMFYNLSPGQLGNS